MSDRLSQHSSAAERMVGEGKKTLQEYVARCQRMTPEQFAMEPRRLTARLSAAQYAEIVRALVPDAPMLNPTKPTKIDQSERPGKTAPSGVALLSLSKIRSAMEELRRPSIIAALAGIVAVGLGAVYPYEDRQNEQGPMVRSRYINGWPSCYRLSPASDGCLYHTQTPLTWSQISELLTQDLPTLHVNNPNLPTPTIPPESTIVIWRGRGDLVEVDQ